MRIVQILLCHWISPAQASFVWAASKRRNPSVHVTRQRLPSILQAEERSGRRNRENGDAIRFSPAPRFRRKSHRLTTVRLRNPVRKSSSTKTASRSWLLISNRFSHNINPHNRCASVRFYPELISRYRSTSGLGGDCLPCGLSLKRGISLQRRLLNDLISKKPLRRVSLLQPLAGEGCPKPIVYVTAAWPNGAYPECT